MRALHALLLAPLALLAACGGGGSGGTDDDGPNSAPTAEWGTVSNASTGIALVLDGTGSFDPDGDDLEYFWEILAAPLASSAAIVGDRNPIATLTPDVVGTYEIRLVVTDGFLESLPKTRSINVTDIPIWEETGGPVGGRVEALEMLPGPGTNGKVWYASVRTNGGGVGLYRTIDGGAGWRRVEDDNDPLITSDVLSLSGDATDSGDEIFAGTTTGVARSLNVGTDWESADDGLPAGIRALLLRPQPSPTSPRRLFAGTFATGIRYSDDFGDTWETTSLVNVGVNDLVVAADLNTFHAATTDGVWTSGASLGLDWVQDPGLSGEVLDVEFVFGVGAFALADSVYQRVGGTWIDVGIGLPTGNLNTLGLTPGGWLIAGGPTDLGQTDGLFRWNPTIGGGWQPIGTDIPSRPEVLCIDSDDTTTLIGTTNGLFKSTDDGQSWSAVGLVFSATTVRAFGHEDAIGDWAATDFGVYWRETADEDWDQVADGFVGRRISAVGADWNGRLYAADRDRPAVLHTDGPGGDWEVSSTGFAPGLGVQCLTFPRGSVVAGTSLGVYRSIDEAASWSLSISGMPLNADVRDFATAPSGRLYAATANVGLYRSDTGGQSWAPIAALGAQNFASVAVVPTGGSGPETLVAGQLGGALLFSQDGGLTWESSSAGSTSWNDLTVFQSQTLYAATSAGALRSFDRGRTWERLDEGLEARECLAVSVDDASRVILGTFAAGVWMLP